MRKTIQEIVRDAETNYTSGTVTLGKYVDWSMYDTVERINAYINSTHLSGETDSLGREKPFFNIVNASVNIWYRATDLDRKDIAILPDRASDVAQAFIATVLLQDWMKKARFGVFLNQWGRTLAQYGSAVTKFVEKNGELTASVIPWNRFISDPIDFYALPRIEKLYKTPAQLENMATPGHPDYAGYNKETVKALMDATTSRKDMQGTNVDNRSEFIELYEVHGELPIAFLSDDPIGQPESAWERHRQQMHVVSFSKTKDGFSDFTLFKGPEAKDPYMLTHLIEEDGRTLSRGAVEELFHAQWMQNHSVKNIKDTLDLASKLIFQTADTRYAGRNVLSAIETGDIFIHGPNMPLTRVANDKPDITAFQNFQSMWKNLANELASTPDALKGNTLPSGTPYSLGALLTANASNLFEQMTENKGLHLEDMLRTYVIPHLKKKMDNTDEIAAILGDRDIKQIDAMYVPRQAIRNYNDRAAEQILTREEPLPFNQPMEEEAVRKSLAPLGNKRFFVPSDISEKTWKEALKDLEWRLEIQVTNEFKDKQVLLQTLATVLQSIAANPQILTDPNAKMLFNKILSATGTVSPIELSATTTMQPQAETVEPLQALAQQTYGTKQ